MGGRGQGGRESEENPGQQAGERERAGRPAAAAADGLTGTFRTFQPLTSSSSSPLVAVCPLPAAADNRNPPLLA